MANIVKTENRQYIRDGRRLISTTFTTFSGGFTFARYFLDDQRTLITLRDGTSHTGRATDVRVNCADGHFFAHRFLLSASPFLRSFFSTGVSNSVFPSPALYSPDFVQCSSSCLCSVNPIRGFLSVSWNFRWIWWRLSSLFFMWEPSTPILWIRRWWTGSLVIWNLDVIIPVLLLRPNRLKTLFYVVLNMRINLRSSFEQLN